jgi:hypothetical protein
MELSSTREATSCAATQEIAVVTRVFSPKAKLRHYFKERNQESALIPNI